MIVGLKIGNICIDFYYINEQWFDSFLYFSSPKGAHALYNSTVDDSNQIIWLLLLGIVAGGSFIAYKLVHLIWR